MPAFPLKTLVGKLNPVCRRALEAAAGLSQSRTNYNVELEHYLLKLLEFNESDLPRLLQHYEVNPSKVARELTRGLDKLKTGSARIPQLSTDILDALRDAWTMTSLN